MTKQPSPPDLKVKRRQGRENADKPLERFNELTKSILTVSNKAVKELETVERRNKRRKRSAGTSASKRTT